MVGLLTFGKKKFESVDDVMRKTISPLHDNLQAMLPLVDKDSDAFTEYIPGKRGRERRREGEREGEMGLREKGLHAQRKINHSLAHTPLPPSLPLPHTHAPSLVLCRLL